MQKSLLILFILFLFSCQSEQEEIKPKMGKLTESVYASIQVEPLDYYTVYPISSGIIEKVFVDDGDSVSQGQLIAMISTDKSKLNVQDANINFQLAKEKFKGQETVLANILEELELNESQLKLDSINYTRQLSLWNQSIGSKAEVDAKELKYKASQSKSNLLKKNYSQSKFELESMYKQSINALERAEDNLEDLFIRSTIDGKVYTFNKKEGELVLPQEAIATIGNAKEFVVRMSVDEVDVRKVALNQLALVSLDAYDGEVFELNIDKIYPTKDPKTQTFTLEASFTNPPEKLFVGLSGEANIIISEVDNALWIPREYLYENNKVNTKNGEVVVEIGLKNMSQVQILSGIDSSSTLIKP